MKFLTTIGFSFLMVVAAATQNSIEGIASENDRSLAVNIFSNVSKSSSVAYQLNVVKSSYPMIPSKTIKRIALATIYFIKESLSKNILITCDNCTFYLDGVLTKYSPGIVLDTEIRHIESIGNGTPAAYESFENPKAFSIHEQTTLPDMM